MGLAVTLACSPLSQALVVIYVDQSAAGLDDGTSWDDAYINLQVALADAAVEALSDDVEIWVAQGTYIPGGARSDTFTLLDNVAIYGGFSGTETLVSERNSDPETNNTVLSGDLDGDDGANFTNYDDNSHHVVTGTGVDATAVLDGFTIRGGYADTATKRGGGFICDGEGSPTVSNCVFRENSATGTFANEGFGGAVSLNATPTTDTQPIFTDCQFINNHALTRGGAVDLSNACQPTFLRCTFVSNVTNRDGGALFCDASAITIQNCSFLGNSCIETTSANLTAGAIFIRGADPAGPGRIINTEFIGNESEFIGACYNLQGADVIYTNCSFSGNRGRVQFGAVYNSASGGTVVKYNNCIIWNNLHGADSASLNASIANAGGTANVEISHCIIANSGGSGAPLGSAPWNSAAGTDMGGNLDADPLFYTPADPSTTPNMIGDLRLLTGSPGANSGTNSADLDGAGSGTDTIASIANDLAGATRIQNATIEIGAYEGEFVNPLDTFAELFPGLTTGGDENGNGIDNFLEYALGYDPEGANDASILPTIDGNLWMVSYRTGVIDATPVYRMSSTLSSWTDMELGVHYTVQSVTPDTDREDAVLLLDPSVMANPKMFFTEFFSVP